MSLQQLVLSLCLYSNLKILFASYLLSYYTDIMKLKIFIILLLQNQNHLLEC